MGSYFIKIEDGPDVRRKILESSKANVHILQGYHTLLKIRGEKLTHMQQLRTELRELSLLLNRAEALMPFLTERDVEELNPKPKPVLATSKLQDKKVAMTKNGKKVFVGSPTVEVKMVIPAPPKVDLTAPKAPEPEKPKPMTELEKLEAALSQIERKLTNI